MKPRHRVTRRRDPFADEPTTPYDAVPELVDDETTMPVDVDEMEGAARRSCAAFDVHEPDPIVVAPAARHARPRPYVELSIVGHGHVVQLPLHRVSPTGVVLVVPPGVAVHLAADTAVMALVHLLRDGAAPTRARLPAQVVHHREPDDATAGGLSLRWDVRTPDDQRRLDDLLATQAAA
ncbi:MAG: hypothetical protein H6709_12110 [Kofleriaceae bacterium]|nr:hypothetical protein [Kofleriaceae bacterium]MCB9572821.1 hypothetical protein [Kofleriaceae bacterium]